MEIDTTLRSNIKGNQSEEEEKEHSSKNNKVETDYGAKLELKLT